MRDYLEELTPGGGALLEELQRAERRLSGLPSGEETEARKPEEADRTERIKDRTEDMVDNSENVSKILGTVDNTVKDVPKYAEIEWEAPDARREAAAPGERRDMAVNRTETTGDDSSGRNKPGGILETDGEKRSTNSLAVRLERLDRAVLTSAAGTDVRRRDETRTGHTLPLRRAALPGLAPGETASAGRVGLPAPGGETDWIEQADQAFRRDSRRYDGGFYLY